ncbi:hypothetical protein I302_105172 [Kwoniella bestiolae CBS 10118]|uniref:NmrA-like domain-containing protein n=1 Tax=Kwoniella bestiolae CBS 10118 TaxID=1296100 RepID=A0A1B9FSE5_9TREE|nr:hypothetical protein I302_08460 [Kwoniella bestiolae CBS 10118]OCF21683.1 hypothetical protein I302_08460 [Kwoniella bestiolae CBS 10118]
MSSPIQVAFLGHKGLIGSNLLSPLLKSHQEGKINLIILHRQGSDVSSPNISGLEKRVIQLDEEGLEINKEAMEGLEVVISSITSPAILSQTYFLEALKGSKTLKTFIHSDFGGNFTSEDLAHDGMALMALKPKVVARAVELGVPITNVRTGMFAEIVFGYNALGINVKENSFEVYKDNIKNQLRTTTLPYWAHALSQLILDPLKLANKTIQLYDHTPTGQEIIDTLSKIHGTPTKLTHYTTEQYEKDVLDPQSAIQASVKRAWGEDDFGEGEQPEVSGWVGKDLEELLRGYL